MVQAPVVVAALSFLLGQLPGVPGPAPDPAPKKPVASPTYRGPCTSPKTAVGSWLDNLQDNHWRPKAAAVCAQTPEGWSEQDVQRALTQLKRVVDARGIEIKVEAIPDDPDFTDPSTGVPRVEVTSRLPDLQVERFSGKWMFTSTSLLRAERIYKDAFPLDLQRIVTDHFPAWSREPVFGIAAWQVFFLFVLFLVGMLLRQIISGLISSQLQRLMRRLGVQWGEKLLSKVTLPLGNLGLAAVLALGLPSLQFGLTPAQVLGIAVRVLAALSVVQLVYRSMDLFGAFLQAKAAKTDTKLDDQLVPILIRGMKVATVVIGVIFILQNLDIDVTSLLTGLGLGGLAFALAAKDVVSNFFGSVTIFLDKPFQIGDWVVVAGVEGVIEEVGIRSTRIRTFYNSLVTVPNGKFTDAIVDNYGMRKYRRTSTTLGLTYDTPPERIEAFCNGVRAILKAHPAVRKDYYEVHFAGFGDFTLNIMLYFFFTVGSWTEELRARHEIYLDLLRLADELGVSFAFPTQTLHVDSVAEARPPPERSPLDKAALEKRVAAFGPGGAGVIEPGPRVGERFLPG